MNEHHLRNELFRHKSLAVLLAERFTDADDERRRDTLLAAEIMSEAGLKRLEASDITLSLRTGVPSPTIIEEAMIPAFYFKPATAEARSVPSSPRSQERGSGGGR